MSKEYIGGTILMVLCFVIAASILILYLRRRANSRVAQRWPKAEATIIESRMQEVVRSQGYKQAMPVIRYRWQADGAEHESGLVTYAPLPNSRVRVRNLVLSFKEGSTHPVHYNPRRPGEGVLLVEPPSADMLIPAFIFLIFAGVGAYIRTM